MMEPKQKRGSKVYMAVDTLGHLLALHVTAAHAQERASVVRLAARVQAVTADAVEVACVDQGDTGDQPARAAADGLGGGAPSRPLVALPPERGVDGLTRLIDGAIQVTPVPAYFDIRLPIRQLHHTGRLRRWKAASSWGLYFRTQRLIVA
jgi:hypothetical protein